ncbi:uncharacterized protein VP01_307g4 [Puccinia sorghi]|uniref:SWIM-type domain-containing protein n=1 Tax=Puccinia sorghi TaxID=27349 RepID=A0A0L6V1I2_9BASI|nr:uncharacterized protein VP01_307g4 [Puccinia sorghi]
MVGTSKLIPQSSLILVPTLKITVSLLLNFPKSRISAKQVSNPPKFSDRSKKNMSHWSCLVRILTPNPDLIKFLEKFWIPCTPRFVNGWTKNILELLLESNHLTYIKTHLLNSQAGFPEVVKIITLALKEQHHKIKSLFHQQKITSLQNINIIFATCHGKIINFALQTAQNCYMTIDHTSKEWCNQAQMVRTGMPCSHKIAQLLVSGRRVEPSDFHRQWHLKCSESIVDIQLPQGAQTTRLQPTSAAKEPQNTEPCDPSGFEYVQPKKPKLQVKEEKKNQLKEEEKTQTQPTCSSSIKKQPSKEIAHAIEHDFYLGQGFFHKLENTAAQIWVDNKKTCGISHWISMPTTGNLLVELYNRPVFYFSSSWSQSSFPSSTSPNNNPPIFLALTSTWHFLALKMEDETFLPAPQYKKNWEKKLAVQRIEMEG